VLNTSLSVVIITQTATSFYRKFAQPKRLAAIWVFAGHSAFVTQMSGAHFSIIMLITIAIFTEAKAISDTLSAILACQGAID
jgi:hypothetical protein